MGPEKEVTEESQEEFGWEDLSSQDDGTRDMGEPVEVPEEPAAKPAETEVPAAETAEEASPEQETPTGEAAATQGESEEEAEERVYTLPGGEKIKESELIANPDLLNKLVTHSNQLTHYQSLADQRKKQLEEAELDRRRMLDEYTAWQMQQQQMQQMQTAAPEPQRPGNQVLQGIFSPHLDSLVQQGRLTADQKEEFGNVLCEYMFDIQNLYNMGTNLATALSQRIDEVGATVAGDLIPDTQRRRQIDAVQEDKAVQAKVASQPGYESLQDPNEWERLRSFILEKVYASPRNPDGSPSFNPNFDPETMAQMYDAMTGGDVRKTLEALKSQASKRDTQNTAMAGGETTSKAGSTPKPKQPSKMTPEEEAMDFSDPNMSTG
jgi:hypothetical protein